MQGGNFLYGGGSTSAFQAWCTRLRSSLPLVDFRSVRRYGPQESPKKYRCTPVSSLTSSSFTCGLTAGVGGNLRIVGEQTLLDSSIVCSSTLLPSLSVFSPANYTSGPSTDYLSYPFPTLLPSLQILPGGAPQTAVASLSTRGDYVRFNGTAFVSCMLSINWLMRSCAQGTS